MRKHENIEKLRLSVAVLSMVMLASGQSFAGEIRFEAMKKRSMIVADDATASEQYAAVEFQFLFRQLTGVRIDYVPQGVKYPQLWWRPQYRQVNLELFSQEQEVKPGQSLSMAYQFRFLAEPPVK